MTNKNEARAMTEHISCDCNCKFNSAKCNSNQKWNKKHVNVNFKKYHHCKNCYSWNPSTCFFLRIVKI